MNVIDYVGAHPQFLIIVVVLLVWWFVHANRKLNKEERLIQREQDVLQLKRDIEHDRRLAKDPRGPKQSFLGELFDAVMFGHPRTPHCPCVKCKIAELDDLL